jgi:hypothetical protein
MSDQGKMCAAEFVGNLMDDENRVRRKHIYLNGQVKASLDRLA